MPLKPRMIRTLDASELFQYALNLLGGRALSVSEVRTKLTRKAAHAEDVPGVISKLKEYGYLDDARFAEGYASARKDSGNYGKMRVLRDLRQRRVASPTAQHAVDQAYEDTDEAAMVEQWLRRKFRAVNLAEYLREEKHLASTYRKLRYAGFSSSASIRALKRFAERADELADEPDAPDLEP
jgi:regulatory protein